MSFQFEGKFLILNIPNLSDGQVLVNDKWRDGPILGNVKGAIQIERASHGQDRLVTSLVVPEADIQEAFRPRWIGKRLDQSSASIREGMRITFELLKQMDMASRENSSHFVVVLIPTKETVFADYLLSNPQIHLSEIIEKLICDEEAARKQLIEFLDKAGIPYVDMLPALRREVSKKLYTRSDRDMHPGKNGYKIIGEAVAEFLRNRRSVD